MIHKVETRDKTITHIDSLFRCGPQEFRTRLIEMLCRSGVLRAWDMDGEPIAYDIPDESADQGDQQSQTKSGNFQNLFDRIEQLEKDNAEFKASQENLRNRLNANTDN